MVYYIVSVLFLLGYFLCLCDILAWRLMDLYSQYTTINSGFLPDILLFTQAPIFVWFDGTIIDIIISTILLTMYYSVYVLL